MERSRVSDATLLPGYDTLRFSRYFSGSPDESIPFEPAPDYDRYQRIHKVYVGKSGSRLLRDIHEKLKSQQHPEHLDAAAWAAAEAAIVDDSLQTPDRIGLVEAAERCWEHAILRQQDIDSWLPDDEVEDDASFRFALNLAFTPMMKALVVGNVTDVIREQVFSDVLAVAQSAGIQRSLASAEASTEAFNQLLGFEHECNAHLALLFANDPRYLPLPSSARAGSGRTYPEQTHDIVVVNQHWGKIRKVIPVEIKSRASLNDIKRYDALVVRGKMHLSVAGKYSPEHTRQAFAGYYDGSATRQDTATVYQVSSTIKTLLALYQKGSRQNTQDTPTSYHDLGTLRQTHPEFSLHRPRKY